MNAMVFKFDRSVKLSPEGVYEVREFDKNHALCTQEYRAIHVGGVVDGAQIDKFIIIEHPEVHEAFENGAKLTNLLMEDTLKWEALSGWGLIRKGIKRIFTGK